MEFSGNNIKGNFSNNKISTDFKNNSIEDNFQNNDINNKNFEKTKKKSRLERLSWIVGTIAGLTALYEFVLKHLFESL